MTNSKTKGRGFVYTMAIAFNKIVPAGLFRFGIMDVLQLSREKLAGLEPQKEATITRVTDLEKRRELKSITRNGFPDKITSPHLALALQDSGTKRMAGGLWVAIDRFVEPPLNFCFEFTPRQAWIYSAYVLSDFRLRGNYAACLNRAADELGKSNRNELLVAFNPFNKASAIAHEKYVERRIGRVVSICLLGVAICFRSGLIQKSKTIGTKASLVKFSCDHS